MNTKSKSFKIICAVLAFVVVVATIITIVVVNKNSYATVTFDTDGGTQVESIKVKKNTCLESLPKTEKENYDFLGWFVSEEKTEAFNIDTPISSDITLYAGFKLTEYVTISFDTKGGETITPLKVRKGAKLTLDEMPKAVLENYFFVEWYFENTLENSIDYENYVFDENITLYAGYSVIPDSTKSINFYEQEETSLFSQPKNKALLIDASGVSLTDSNIKDYLTVTSLDETSLVPNLTVKSKNGLFEVLPSSDWSEGGNYSISLKNPLKFNVLIEETEQNKEQTIQVGTLNLHIFRENTTEYAYNENAIDIKVTDYYYISNNLLYLNKSFVNSKTTELKSGDILKVFDEKGKFEFYKAGNFSLPSESSLDAVCVELLAPELQEVYSSLDMFEEGKLSSENVFDKISNEELIETLKSSEGFEHIELLTTAAVCDYAKQNSIPIADLSSSESKVQLLSGEKVEGIVNAFTFDISKEIKINSKAKAKVNIVFTQTVGIGYGTKGHIKWFTDYDIDIYGLFSSYTQFSVDVVLTVDGKTSNIKSDIAKLIKEPNADSLVADYQRNCKLDTDSITLISVKLFEARVSLDIIDFTFPVTLNVRMDVNAAFAADYESLVSYKTGIKGSDNKGISAYKEQNFNNHHHTFYFNGRLSFETGIEIAMEVSFAGLNKLGCIGLGIEIGCYFDFYGIGSYEINKYTYLNDDNKLSQGSYKKFEGTHFYEFGIFLDLHLYAESELFNVRAQTSLAKLKIPVFSAGQPEVALEFVTKESDIILYGEDSFGILSDNLIDVKILNLKTAKTRVDQAKLENIVVYCNNKASLVSDFDTKTGIVTVDTGAYNRFDETINIAYFGDRFGVTGCGIVNGVNSWYKPMPLISTINFTYLEEYISEEDLDQTYTATYKVEGEVVATETVKIGASPMCTRRNVLLEGALAEHFGFDKLSETYPYVEALYFADDGTMMREDRTYDASFIYKEYAHVKFSYMKSASGRVEGGEYWIDDYVYAGVGSKFNPKLYYEETDQLEKFDPKNADINEYIKFKGWSADGVTVPSVGEGETFNCIAEYEYVPFEVTIEIPALYDYYEPSKLLLGEQAYTMTTTYGTMPEFPIQTHPYFELRYSIDGFSETIKNYGKVYYVTKPCTIKPEWNVKNTASVVVVDHEDKVLVERNYLTIDSDESSIMEETAVKDYEANIKELSTNSTFLTKKFVGWYPLSQLESVWGTTVIKPRFDYVYQYSLVKFDGNGGKIPSSLQYTANKGIEVLKGDEDSFTKEFLDQFAPDDKIVDGVLQTFSDWELEKTVSSTGQNIWTYYAQFVEKPYSVTISSQGVVYTVNEQGELEITNVDASFSDESKSKKINGTYAQISAFANSINDASSEFEKPILAQDSLFEFYRWQVLEVGAEWEIIPEFTFGNGTVTIEYNIGKGNYSSHTEKLVDNFAISNADTFDLPLANIFEPNMSETVTWFNASTLEYEQIDCCYFDDESYYTLGYWADENGNKIADDTVFSLKSSDTLVLNYVYTQVARTYYAKFSLKSANRESFVGFDGFDYFVNIEAGKKIDETLIPSVKRASEELSLYEYNFSHWKCVETENSGFDNEIFADYSFEPVFTRDLREITITYDAGEYGTFLSTNSRYRTQKLGAGSVIYDFGETPVYQSPSKYFNYVFDAWDTAMTAYGFRFENSSTVGAKFKKIRNAVKTDAPVGITISNGLSSEDIGSGRISGYQYDPDENILKINESGLTITSDKKAVDVMIMIMASNTTLKDITLNNANIFTSATENIVVKFDGEVILNTNGSAIGNYGKNTTLEGVNENAKLTVNFEKALGDLTTNHCLITSVNLEIKNLQLELNANAPFNDSINAIYMPATNTTLSIVNSDITLTIDGGANGYLIFLEESANFEKDQESTFTTTGCELSNKAN